MGSHHPPALRSQALELISGGHSVRDVARRLGLPQQTVYRWSRTGASQSELMQAHARIEKLENEIATCRRVIDFMKEVMPPKGDTR
ncbi:transposase [Streptomyces sp. NPDC001634]|uniref:transposase n=1 Tax=Streptomyces sp. NPDC001634 TaxID=3154390 RepID=UPI003327D377